MSETPWDRIVDAIDNKYGITEHGRYQEPLPDRGDLEQKVAFICFEKDGVGFKVEQITRPAIVDKKAHFHKAIGSGSRQENIYDPEQLVAKVNFYRKQGGKFEPIEAEEIAL